MQVLEKYFDTAFDAPDGIKKLRELILTLAMQGKLVPQDPNDQPASELLKEIEKAILVSDIGITPTNDGKAIRLNFPDLTEERRKELAKDVKKRGEEAKVAVRNIRRDANDFVKKQNKAGDLNDDQAKDEEDKVQKMTDKYIKQIDEAVDAKSKEIMTV